MAGSVPQSLEHFLAALTRRQTMLLLTSVTFGGQDSVASFEHLPEDEAALLKHRAAELVQIPRDKRIPLLVQEIKRLVTARRGQLWAADPGRVANLLKDERPAMVEVVLRALPVGLADAVREFMPNHMALLQRDVKPEVLSVIRWKLEELLTREAPQRAMFKFSDVLLLQSRELFTLCDRLGARSLSLALAGLPEAEREAFLQALSPDQRGIAERALAATNGRALSEDDARVLLELHGIEDAPAGALRSAGVHRLARACLAQSPDFAARVLERHRGEFGQLFAKWMREERNRATNLGDGGRSDIVAELERLENKGIIDRPIRLPPPKKREVLPPAIPRRSISQDSLPGGRVLSPSVAKVQERSVSSDPRAPRAPEPRAAGRRSSSEEIPRSESPPRAPDPRAGRRSSSQEIPRSEAPPRRDVMAERAAREAGAVPDRRGLPEHPAQRSSRDPEESPTDPLADPPTILARPGGRRGGRGPEGGSR